MTSGPDRRAQLQKIDVLLGLRRFSEAADLASQGLGSAPEDVDLLCRLAQAQLHLTDLANALVTAQRAIAADPSREWPFRLASIIHRQARQYREAVAAARVAVSLAPLNWQTHVTLAQALLRETPERTEAMAEARRGLELAPDRAEPHVVLGEVEAASGNTKAAAEAFRRALEIDPQNPVAHNELARTHLRAGTPLFGSSQLAAATEGFANVVQADPRAQFGRRNLELAISAFIYRTAYLLFLVALLGVYALSRSTLLVARLVPVLLLLVPVGFGVRFVARLSPSLRSFTLQFVRGSRPRLVAVLLEAASAVLIATSALFRGPVRWLPLQLGAACALAALILVIVMTRSRVRPAIASLVSEPPPSEPRAVLGTGVRHAPGTGPSSVQRDHSRPSQVRSAYLWLLLVALPFPAIGAVALALAPVPAAARAVGATLFVVLVALSAVLVLRLRDRARRR